MSEDLRSYQEATPMNFEATPYRGMTRDIRCRAARKGGLVDGATSVRDPRRLADGICAFNTVQLSPSSGRLSR